MTFPSKTHRLDWTDIDLKVGNNLTKLWWMNRLHTSEVYKKFSWARVRNLLSDPAKAVEDGTLFAHDGMVFLDMIYSGSMLLISPNRFPRVGLMSREDFTRVQYTMLPPKDVELTIKGILERYGRTKDTNTLN